MKFRFLTILCIGLIISFIAGCATDEERQQVRRGAGVGAGIGAAAGLALGAIAGEPAAGMAAGAAYGAAAGAAYEYDQARDDRRTNTLADAIGGAQAGETADDAGKRHLADFVGEWNLDIWALNADGSKLTAKGHAMAALTGKDTLRIDHKDIKADGYDQIFSGYSIVTYSKDSGFSIENHFPSNPDPSRFVGEYIPADNKYNFYPSQNAEGETITGVIKSNIRIELRASSSNLVVGETFSMVSGKEIKIQQYRFTR